MSCTDETISTRLEEAHTQLLIAKTEQEKFQQTIAEYEQQVSTVQLIITYLYSVIHTLTV
jgi:hypothetical protein